jgi:predicted nucleotidyltransferase
VTGLPGLTDPEARQAQAVLDLLETTMGEALHAVILHGSAVSGGLRPDSDLDLLVVTTRRLTAAERRTLLDGLLARSRSPRRRDLPRHLEVTVVVTEDVRPWRYPPRLELQYGDWWRTEFEAGEESPWHSPDPDLAIVLTAARAVGRSLVGPPAADLIDPVPRDDLRRALTAVLPALVADLVDDTRNVLLTLARIASTLEHAEIEPKDVAAERALRWLPHDAAATLLHARDGYLGRIEDRWDEPEARAAARVAADALLTRIEEVGEVSAGR